MAGDRFPVLGAFLATGAIQISKKGYGPNTLEENCLPPICKRDCFNKETRFSM